MRGRRRGREEGGRGEEGEGEVKVGEGQSGGSDGERSQIVKPDSVPVHCSNNSPAILATVQRAESSLQCCTSHHTVNTHHLWCTKTKAQTFTKVSMRGCNSHGPRVPDDIIVIATMTMMSSSALGFPIHMIQTFVTCNQPKTSRSCMNSLV